VKKVNNEVGEKGKNKNLFFFLSSFFFLLLLLLFLSLQVVACAGEITKPNASRLYRLQRASRRQAFCSTQVVVYRQQAASPKPSIFLPSFLNSGVVVVELEGRR
jgi:hypothetical protein